MEERKSKTKDFNKTWIVLLAITASLFLIVGVAKTVMDKEFLNGIQYLISSLLFYVTMFFLIKKKICIQYKSTKSSVFLTLGFIFLIIGLNYNIGVWLFGLIFFIGGIVRDKITAPL